MRTKITVRSFEQVLQILRDTGFDVRELPGVANRTAGQVAVGKYGAAAVLARNPKYSEKTAAEDEQHPVIWITPPGWVLRGKISRLVDHGNQKLFETPTARIAATADALKSVHRFSEELREAIGEPSLYNESLGTVSNSYMYDRLKGREAAPATASSDKH
ncbi:MAG: hypothetical protein WBQ79_09935 [Acidobacteriaceae bacterium]